MSSIRIQPSTSLGEKVAAQSYVNTLKRLQKEFADDPKALKILTSFESVHSIEEALEDIKKSCKGNDERRQSTLHWLNKVSARILYYERVLDALAQHHAEYVSLVWGSIKFVLIGVANYAELVEEFGRAWVQVGDILHDIKLDIHLHETPRILQTYSDMCSHIMEFHFQAIRWCRRSTASRAIHALVNPWSLEYKSILVKIRDCSKTINDLSSAQSRFEIRQINRYVHILQNNYQSFQAVLEDIQLRLGVNEGALDTILKTVTANKSITERVNYNVEEIKPSIYSIEAQLQRFVATGGNDPNMALQKAKAATLRRQNCSPFQPATRVVSALSRWIQATSQAFLILQSSPRARNIAKDLSVHTILQLQRAKYNVLWVFQQRADAGSSEGVEDVLRSLIYQIVARDPKITLDFPCPLHIFREESDCSLKEQQDLLQSLLLRFGSCFIVVESQCPGNFQTDLSILHILKEITECVNRNSGTGVKVISLGTSGHPCPASTEDGNEDSAVIVRVRPTQALPARLRHIRRRIPGPQIVRTNPMTEDEDVDP